MIVCCSVFLGVTDLTVFAFATAEAKPPLGFSSSAGASALTSSLTSVSTSSVIDVSVGLVSTFVGYTGFIKSFFWSSTFLDVSG